MAATDIGSVIRNSVDGYIALGKDIKGGYIAVENTTERDNLPKSNLVKGSLVYVTEENKLYVYDGTSSWTTFMTESIAIDPVTGNWVINGVDTGIYAKGSDSKYVKVCEADYAGEVTVNLKYNTTYIVPSKHITSLLVVFPEGYKDTLGWISEVTFRSEVGVANISIQCPDEIKYYEYGQVVTGLDMNAEATINIIFQYDGINTYGYITDLPDKAMI